jgi:hypothetical protein
MPDPPCLRACAACRIPLRSPWCPPLAVGAPQRQVASLSEQLQAQQRDVASVVESSRAKDASLEAMLREMTTTMQAEVGRAAKMQDAHDQQLRQAKASNSRLEDKLRHAQEAARAAGADTHALSIVGASYDHHDTRAVPDRPATCVRPPRDGRDQAVTVCGCTLCARVQPRRSAQRSMRCLPRCAPRSVLTISSRSTARPCALHRTCSCPPSTSSPR